MIGTIDLDGRTVRVDFSDPLDISIPLRPGADNVNAFYIPPVVIEPFRAGEFIGDVAQGGSCNVNNILFNPHGNGTHTECVGHISKEKHTIYDCLKTFVFSCRLLSVAPEQQGEDRRITQKQLAGLKNTEALVIRTLPNDEEKTVHQYSGTNPPYLEAEAAAWIVSKGVKHLLLDLPSVDREDDDGKLSAHHAFWQYPHATRMDCTITELIFVPSHIPDGDYLLQLQVASFMNDASPSKPVLYKLL